MDLRRGACRTPTTVTRARVRFESIKACKGLAALVAMLCKLDAIEDEPDRDREFYVGASRVRSHLVVMGGAR